MSDEERRLEVAPNDGQVPDSEGKIDEGPADYAPQALAKVREEAAKYRKRLRAEESERARLEAELQKITESEKKKRGEFEELYAAEKAARIELEEKVKSERVNANRTATIAAIDLQISTMLPKGDDMTDRVKLLRAAAMTGIELDDDGLADDTAIKKAVARTVKTLIPGIGKSKPQPAPRAAGKVKDPNKSGAPLTPRDTFRNLTSHALAKNRGDGTEVY